MSSNKQYGLQQPKRTNPVLGPRLSAFDDDSESDKSDGGGVWGKKTSKRGDFSSAVSKRQAKLEIDKAMKEDATVFQYDEVYDEMDQRKQSSNKDKDKKPKYVQKLIAAADRRKVENERRYERQVQKERDNEGDEFKDKETFVTTAYKKKLEEFAKLDAEQKRMDLLEEIGDVTKQQDVSGFYRHLYQTTVGDVKTDEIPPIEQEAPKDADKKKTSCRQYRKQKSSDKDQDADSDFESSSSSSSSSSSESEDSDVKSCGSDDKDSKRMKLKKEETNHQGNAKPNSEVKPEEKTALKNEVEIVAKAKVKNVPAVDIWKKRTVGPLFEAAVNRYLERKAARLVNVS